VSDEVAAADFLVPPGGNWRLTRVVVVGVAYPTPPVNLFQINIFRDNGSGEPGNVLISGIGPVDENAPADPCCGGAVFDYERAVNLDLPPGRYWITNRIRSSTTRTFDPQLAVAVGYPGLIGEVLPNNLMAVPVVAPNNDFAFAVYGTTETPAEAATSLQTTIEGYGLDGGLLNSLLTKLRAAIAAADAGDKTTACGSVQALINLASAQAGKKLTQAQADEIIAQANHLRTVLGC